MPARTQQTRDIDAAGRVRKRITHRGREQWPVFIRDHHAGYIDWDTFDTNQKRLAQDIRPRPHQAVQKRDTLFPSLASSF